ncbi:hypothetical protein Peur_021244 [Populus x canadensis]
MFSLNSPATPPHSSVISMPSVAIVKLNHDNFLLWKAQLIPYFRGQDLFGYIDEDQVMVTEFKGEDIDPPMNSVTGIAEDHTKQSYEDQDSDSPVIEAASNYPP